MLKDNPLFQVAFHSEVHNMDFYIPANDTEYHLSRYVAANAQNIYSASGTTKELLSTYLDEIIKICNDKEVKTVRTDVGTLVNNLKMRMKYPIDEDCALRMGAIYCMADDEDPNQVNETLTRQKVNLAKKDPAMYDFFLLMGIRHTPAWSEYGHLLTDMDYFKKRDEMILNGSLPPEEK